MSHITINDLSPIADLSPEQEALIQGAGMKSFRPTFEVLEDREVYAAHLGSALPPELLQSSGVALGPALVQQYTPASEIQVTGPAATAGVVGSLTHTASSPALDEALWSASASAAAGPAANVADAGLGAQQASAGTVLNPDGTVTVTTKDDVKTYQRVGEGWRMIAFNHQSGAFWVEDSWGADGTFTRNVWYYKQHYGVGSFTHHSQVVVKGDQMTITRYHVKGLDVVSGGIWSKCEDAQERWTYSLDANGKRELVAYQLEDAVKGWDGSDYGLHWTKQNSWSEAPARWYFGVPRGADEAIWKVDPRATTVAVPPGVTVEGEWKGGKWVETVWNKEHTQSVTFVFSGPDRKELLGQTFGRSNAKGQWVETTTHSRDFITRTETYDKLGGKLLARETTRTAADGHTVTFHGQWRDGKWIETADNYLGFRSVTVEYNQPNGLAVKRYGTLHDGRFAVDTFDASGNVTSREVYSGPDKGTLLERYTGDGKSFSIERYFSTGNKTKETLTYTYREGGYELTYYVATYKEPQTFWDPWKMEERKSNHYHWRKWWTQDGEAHYREGLLPAHSNEWNGNQDGPLNGSVPTDPTGDTYWNKQ